MTESFIAEAEKLNIILVSLGFEISQITVDDEYFWWHMVDGKRTPYDCDLVFDMINTHMGMDMQIHHSLRDPMSVIPETTKYGHIDTYPSSVVFEKL